MSNFDHPRKVSPRLKDRFKKFVITLLSEGLTRGKASAAVFLGIFIGVVPIYGLQSITAIGLASLFRLNKMLTFTATFVNNALLQPFLVLSSITTGYLLLEGKFIVLSLKEIKQLDLGGFLIYFIFGSIVFGLLLGIVGAAITFSALTLRKIKKTSG